MGHASIWPKYGHGALGTALVALGLSGLDMTAQAMQQPLTSANVSDWCWGVGGAAYRNRTDDLFITSESLWPTELRRRAPGGALHNYTEDRSDLRTGHHHEAEPHRRQHLRPSAGTVPWTKYASIGLSTQEFERVYAVCPSPS
jgi:hypothetical protein